MQKNKQLLLIFTMLQLCTLFCSEMTYMDLLSKSIARLDGIDHRMVVDITTTKNDDSKESKQFQMSVHWELDNDNYKMIKIDEKIDGAKGLEAWALHYRNDETKKWVMLPKSGKIKDVTGKKSSDKMDFSEVGLDPAILKHQIKFIEDTNLGSGEEKIKCKKIQISTEDESVFVWIDSIDFIVHKKEYYNKKNKLFKEVSYSNLILVDDMKFYKDICIQDHKKKSKVDISLSDFNLSSIDDLNLFSIPKN